ncbi:monooxygenase [Xylaria sp. FL1042]|nr:monooxygenase [Xylaria sp. FL1042]
MSTPASAPIAIIGGGPAGLTLARFLERAGLNYVVFERDPSASANHQGGSLDLHEGTGLTALDAAGLRDEFEKYARYEAAVFHVQDFRGGNKFKADAGEAGNVRPEIDRKQLRQILLDSIPAERVRWGKAVKAIEREQGEKGESAKGAKGWVLKFEDGETEKGFRLIVGADGTFSAVRSLITPAKPKYSGKINIEGRLTPSNPLYASTLEAVGPGSSAAMGAGRVLLLQQMGDRTYRMYAGLEEPDTTITRPGGPLDFASPSADVEKARAALLAHYEGWAPHLRAYIQHAEAPWRVWPLYTLDEETFTFTDGQSEGKANWKRAPGVTLLGDAAHVALPNGEGVNAAMLDSLRLSEALTAELNAEEEKGKEGDDVAAIERAIDVYEKDMRERAIEHVRDGVMMNEMMYQADGAERMIAFFKQFEEQAAAAGQA